ncbi:hypothetical protein [Streptomyces sp. NPDC007856]|uniref:hypothetical protein n=1 Tax=Streptomyces sp. NPDC007856 TaxID=3364781 RepID=UPI0036A0101D
MTAPTERERRKARPVSLPRADDETAVSLIESEIVIVDDDGTEEPFDPASWFD